MKKIFLLLMCTCFGLYFMNAQTTGSFEKTIIFNSSPHTLAFYVPTNYSSSKSYPLVVAVHGCGGSAVSFRNGLIAISNNLDAIILCPDLKGGQMTGAKGLIIPYSIDTAINTLGYNINIHAVYLTGFSCNGQETFKQGWNEVFPFKAIIPFNAWIPSITTDYNFDSKIPTCVCTGSLDASYGRNIALFDSLIAHNGVGKLNKMPGIGHMWNFGTRNDELMECFIWIDSVAGTNSVLELTIENENFIVFPNPVKNELAIRLKYPQQEEIEVRIYTLKGKIVHQTKSASTHFNLNSSELANGTYFVELSSKNGIIGREKFVILR